MFNLPLVQIHKQKIYMQDCWDLVQMRGNVHQLSPWCVLKGIWAFSERLQLKWVTFKCVADFPQPKV